MPLPVVEKPESCKACPLYDSPEGPVHGMGPKDAKMLLVGEAPGEEDAAVRRPFVGGTGRLLNTLLAQSGVNRDDCFVTNTVRCRPVSKEGGRVVNRAPTDTEIRCCAPFLLKEIQEVNPNLIVALGNLPMKTITGMKKGISYVRSVPTPGNKRFDGLAERYKVIGTFHPIGLMRQQAMWPAVVYDFVRAKNESAFPDIRRRPWKYTIHSRIYDVGESLLKQMRDRGFAAHDLETTGLDPRKDTFRCFGISADAGEVHCFDATPQALQFLRDVHADPAIMTVGQNSEGFDIPFQEAKGFKFNGPSYDTLLGFHLLNPDLPKDLGFIGACVTDELYWKDETMYKSGEDALQVGCCKDVHATVRAYEDQMTELKMLGMEDLYFKHIMPLQPVLRALHRRGVKKDQRKAAGWHTVLTRKADELEARLKKALGDHLFNVNSPQQLMDLVYKRMGLPVQYKKTREGFKPSVDADALDALSLVAENDPRYKTIAPMFRVVRTIRTLRKWDATFVRCEQDENGYVHGHFSSAKAANGRLNSFDPNMQNFPLDVREIIVPDNEDCVLLSRDWSQIEWRIAMALAGDRIGLDALAAGRDAHKDAYANAFNVPYDTVTKAQRFEAKTYNYGLLYGRGAASLAAGRPGHPESAIPVERVQDYIDRFFGKYAAYKKSRDLVEKKVAQDHYVETAWKRRRYWYTKQNLPEAFNYPISGSAASMMYEVLVELENELPKGAELRLTVHDEVVLNVSKEHHVLKQALECTRDIMERPFKQITEHSLYPEVVREYYPNGWNCPSDCHIGENWKICKGENSTDLDIEHELRKKLGVLDVG